MTEITQRKHKVRAEMHRAAIQVIRAHDRHVPPS